MLLCSAIWKAALKSWKPNKTIRRYRHLLPIPEELDSKKSRSWVVHTLWPNFLGPVSFIIPCTRIPLPPELDLWELHRQVLDTGCVIPIRASWNLPDVRILIPNILISTSLSLNSSNPYRTHKVLSWDFFFIVFFSTLWSTSSIDYLFWTDGSIMRKPDK